MKSSILQQSRDWRETSLIILSAFASITIETIDDTVV